MAGLVGAVLPKLSIHDWPSPSDYHHVVDQSDPEIAAQAYYSLNALVHDRALRFPKKRALGSFVQDANGTLVLEEYDFFTLNEMVNTAAENLMASRGLRKDGGAMYVGMLGANSVPYLVNEFALGRL
jgi:hypothetical protein